MLCYTRRAHVITFSFMIDRLSTPILRSFRIPFVKADQRRSINNKILIYY